MLLIVSLATTNYIYAETTNSKIAPGQNILNLKIVKQYKSDSWDGYSDEVIHVNANQTYTLVMSYEYVGSFIDDVLDSEFEYELESNGVPEVSQYINDDVNRCIYSEFSPKENFYIFTIPYIMRKENPNYEIMMYEGRYEDFSGFEPYVGYDYEYDEYAELEVNYDDLLETAEIKSLVKAYDANKNIIDLNVVENTYDSSDKLPGNYEITFLALSNGLKKKLHLEVLVKDFTSPKIYGDDQIYVSYDNTPTIDQIKSMYTVSDNVDSLRSSDIYVYNNDYQDGASPGIYQVKLGVKDNAGNETYKTIQVLVMDDEAPSISGPEHMTIYTSDEPFTDSYILSHFKVHDNYDKNLQLEIDENEYQQNQTAGIYKMRLKAVDSSNNNVYFDLYIHVIENGEIKIEVESPIIKLSTKEMMSSQELDIHLKNYLTQLNSDIKNVNITYNEYESNEKKPGTYYVYYDYELENKTYNDQMVIEVEEEKSVWDYWYVGLGIMPVLIGVYTIVVKKRK